MNCIEMTRTTPLYNPYVLLHPALLEAMLRQPMFLVRQYYARGHSALLESGTVPLLLTHYIHHEVDTERAQRHMRLLKKDPYRFLYDSTDPVHREKLFRAAAQPAGFAVYINLMPKAWKASETLKRKISSYVQHQLPWWQYTPKDQLKVTLKDRYGELFLGLLWKHQQTEVNLEAIENFRPCATT